MCTFATGSLQLTICQMPSSKTYRAMSVDVVVEQLLSLLFVMSHHLFFI